jgi:hypothetical protein
MSYIAATYLDSSTWAAGINWMRKAKSAGLTGFILGNYLPEEATAKAKELGFKLIPIINKFGDGRDLHYTLAENIKKGQRCLFTYPDVAPKGGLSEARDATCSREKVLDSLEIATSVANLQNRANTVKLLREKVEGVYKGLLSPRYVLGTWDFWNGFAAFQNYLHEKKYLDHRHAYNELVLNLYVALAGSVSLEIDHD